MHTQTFNWKYANWFLLSGLALATGVYGIFRGFKFGYSDGATRKESPRQFWFYTFALLCVGIVGLIGVLIGIAALLQTN